MPPRWDLLIRGGTLIDPAQGLSARRDVALQGGRVAAVAETLASADAGEVVDAAGALVTPGLIDLHAHVYDGALPIGMHADRAALVNGVTKVVDAVSAGWMTLAGFSDYVFPSNRTRDYAYLHIIATGIATVSLVTHLCDLRYD